MEEKNSFFGSLNSKSALLVGILAVILVLCTIGFFIMLGIYFGGKSGDTVKAGKNAELNNNTNTSPAVVKSDRPVVELFVMSYCPYGLQMEKAFLPVWELLKNKADFSLKFVSYAMHGKKELDENTRQYCIEKEQPTKYLAYLNCFFSAGTNNGSEAKYANCLNTAGINQTQLSNCLAATDKTFSITAKFNDQSTWLSGQYPVYPVHSDLNDKYGVQGSPTLIINGAEAAAGRNPEAVKQVVCAAFKDAPAECSQKLSEVSAVAGFGSGAGSDTGAAACGN